MFVLLQLFLHEQSRVGQVAAYVQAHPASPSKATREEAKHSTAPTKPILPYQDTLRFERRTVSQSPGSYQRLQGPVACSKPLLGGEFRFGTSVEREGPLSV